MQTSVEWELLLWQYHLVSVSVGSLDLPENTGTNSLRHFIESWLLQKQKTVLKVKHQNAKCQDDQDKRFERQCLDIGLVLLCSWRMEMIYSDILFGTFLCELSTYAANQESLEKQAFFTFILNRTGPNEFILCFTWIYINSSYSLNRKMPPCLK